jgi:dUTP pyrophosphatase
VTIEPGQRVLVPTGISIALPKGYVALVHPRSGLAIKHGISLVNTPGTVDAAYRGELACILINLDTENAVSFKKGDRIAQLVIQEVEEAEFIEVESLPGSDRGAGGFGSTGKSS